MTFDKIYDALVQYGGTYETAQETFGKEREFVYGNYVQNSDAYVQKINDATEKKDTAIKTAGVKVLEVSRPVFEDLRNQIEGATMDPVPADFRDSLETLKTINNPTAKEVDLLVMRFTNNYMCYRAMCDCLHGKVNQQPVPVTDKDGTEVNNPDYMRLFFRITVDDVLNQCDRLESTIERLVDGRPLGRFGFDAVASPEADYLDRYAAMFTAFIEKRFAEAARLIKHLPGKLSM